MTLILWTGKNGELLFHRRRCSRDRAVVADILTLYQPSDLCVSPYSAPLFPDAHIISDLSEAEGKTLFLEDLPLSSALDKAQKLLVYRFDRVYPADVTLQIPNGFALRESTEFTGFSHQKITREVYEK